MSIESLRELIVGCRRCDLSLLDPPVPCAGSVPAEIVVMGDMPTFGTKKPFTDEAGKLLSTYMTAAGIAMSDVMAMNVISCTATDDGCRRRLPRDEEVNACSDIRAAQLEAARPKWVLLAGMTALGLYRPDLKLSHAHGRPFQPQCGPDYPVFMPIYHPDSVLRNPKWGDDLAADLAAFVELRRDVSGGRHWSWSIPETCVDCGVSTEEQGTFRVDDMGFTFCGDCAKEWGR